jgi:glycine betaine/proline transport system substrate-binding protein
VLDDTRTAFGPPDKLTIVATTGWSAANPEVAGWLKNFTITPEQLSDLMLAIQNGGRGNEDASTKDWIARNQQVTDAWLTGTGS